MGYIGERNTVFHMGAHLNHVGMVDFAKIFYFTDGRHVEAIFELPNFDLLDSHLAACRYFPP